MADSSKGRWTSRPTPRVIELAGDEIYDRADEIFRRLSQDAEIVLVRKLPEILHLRELLLDYLRTHYSDDVALRAKGSLFDRRIAPDAETVAAYVAAARHMRDTLTVPALFSRLVQSFNLPRSVNIDCGYFRLVLPDQLANRMELQPDRSRRDDWDYAPPFNGTEPIFARGSALPHRDISYPYYAFQINFWFPLLKLDETETLLFFPDAYYDYKQRVEQFTGGASTGFVDDNAKLESSVSANLNPSDWGFGKPISRAMDVGDVWIFYSQQVHGSPVRHPDSLRLSVEVRAAGRSLDDNSGYRKIFSNLNNFLSSDPQDNTSPKSSLARASALAVSFDGGGRQTAPSEECAQLYLNSLFPTPLAARTAKELSAGAEKFDLAPAITGNELKRTIDILDNFPFADDRPVLLARLLLRRGENDAAARLISRASEQSDSYFWQLQYAHIALRAQHKELARTLLERCRVLALDCHLDSFPFAPPLEVPAGPIIVMLPEHALRAAHAISASLDHLPEGFYSREVCYFRDPRLFHPHTYFMRTHQKADFYNAGSLLLGLPAGAPLITADIVGGACELVCFGDTVNELEYEYTKLEAAFASAATQNLPMNSPPSSVPPGSEIFVTAQETPAPPPDSSKPFLPDTCAVTQERLEHLPDSSTAPVPKMSDGAQEASEHLPAPTMAPIPKVSDGVGLPQLVGNIGYHNLVRWSRHYYGLQQALGRIELEQYNVGVLPGVTVAESLEALRKAINSAQSRPLWRRAAERGAARVAGRLLRNSAWMQTRLRRY